MNNKLIVENRKRICFLGNLSHKKGYMLLVLAFQAIHEFDPEFTLHLGGKIDESRAAVFLDHSIVELGLQDSIAYHGYIDEPVIWLKQFDYGICTSPLEGNPVGVLEFLSVGLTPLLYSFVGCRDQFPDSYIWKTFPELIEMVKIGPRNPQIFKDFVQENYSQEKQFTEIDEIIENLLEDTESKPEIVKNSTVSCVIAVKNGEKTIKQALGSLLCQTKKLDQIIVVNDGSTDNTLKVLSKFAVFKDSSSINTQIITTPSSRWVFSARNIGVDAVTSDYFFFLDADDFVDEKYVEKMVSVLDQNNMIDVVYPDIIYFDDQGNEKKFDQPEFNTRLLAQRNFIAYASMQRTSVFKELGGFSDYMNDCRNHLTEWELWLYYAKAGKGIVRLPEPLFHYFHDDSGDQMSSGYERSRDDMQLELARILADDQSDIQMTGKDKRIVLICNGKDYCDRSKVGFELMQLYKPLETFGDVFVFQYDVEMEYYGQSEMQNRLIAFLNLIKPDYVFHFSYKSDILPRTWNELTDKYCTICFNSDDDRRYAAFTKDYGKAFRYSITTYPSIYERMAHPGRILSQWGANQFYFQPIESQNINHGSNLIKDIDVSFIGQKYGNREEMLSGLNVEIYGSGWPNGFVDFKDVGKIIARSKISINFSKGADGNDQLKLRIFEICACNTLCLCEYVSGIEEYYNLGMEIITFDTKKELEELIAYYLTHPDSRKALAQNAYERTIKDHLWYRRLDKIFSLIQDSDCKENGVETSTR